MQTNRKDCPSKRSSRPIGWWLAILLAGLVSTGLARGQAVTVLDSFNGANGAIPSALILASDGNFYGTTCTGGSNGSGCVYQVTPAGVVTILHSFGMVTNDGAMPTAGLIQASDGNLYGTTSRGGAASKGTVYSITLGGVETVVYSFGAVANDGATPHGSLVQGSDNLLYGTTSAGGSAGNGTIFSMTLLGSETILHNFGDNTVANDGSTPEVALTSDGQGNFYGTTFAGGAGNAGTVFVMNALKQVSTLYSFDRPTVISFSSGNSSSVLGGPGGYGPDSRLTLGLDGNLYGTTAGSGYGFGAIYKITPQGQESVLHYFGDGSLPIDGHAFLPLVENVENVLTEDSGGNFYGTTAFGGAAGLGTLYELTAGGQVSILHSFGATFSDGILPLSGVVLGSGGTLYGTTGAGGLVGLNPTGEMLDETTGSRDLNSTGSGITVLPAINLSNTLTLNSGNLLVMDSSNPLLFGGNPGTFSISSGVVSISSPGGSSTPAHFGTVFVVNPALPEITSRLRVFSGVGADFSYQITATQNPTAFAATGLPDGLTIDANGLISGTPMSAGTSDVTITVTNAVGSTSATLVLTVLAPPAITSLLSEFGTTGTIFDYQIAATGSPYSYSATGLPAGLTIDPIGGIIYGTPTATGTFPVTTSASNAAGTDTETLNLVIGTTAPTLSQKYVLIHSFDDDSTSGEGDFPGSLVPGPNSTFFGVTSKGGANSSGTVFNLSASGLDNVLSALGHTYGSAPQGLVLGPGGNYYGTTQNGGSAGEGTVFMITPAGTVTLLHTFGTVTGDGANPQAGLILGDDGNFYGTTQYGGTDNLGTIFKMTPDGVVTILHSFSDGSVTNDGAQPVAPLVEDGGVFYGTTLQGGYVAATGNVTNAQIQGASQSAGNGTVFQMTSDGTVKILHEFGLAANDGMLPHSALTYDPVKPGVLYGTTSSGGSAGQGTIYSITATGALQILHHFGDKSVTNDGADPIAPVLIRSYSPPGTLVVEDTLYGTTPSGGSAGFGTVFSMDSSGNVTIIHHFGDGTVTNDGMTPMAGLCLDAAGNLYGTTIGGGSGSGTMFAIVSNLNGTGLPILPPSWTCTGNLPAGMTFDPTTGTITGTPESTAPVGNYAVSITSPDNVTTTQVLTLTQTFGQWATAKGNSSLSTGTVGNDGVSAALKYVFDINPATTMTAADHAAMPTGGYDTSSVPDKAFVTLTYRKNAAMTGFDVSLETSDDMVNWSAVPTQNMLSKQISTDTTTTSNDPIMEVGAPADGSPAQFVRLKVTPR